MSPTRHPVLTVGHSTHSCDAFVELLRSKAVTALADIRSAPYSRFNPDFNRDILEKWLVDQGVRYVFLGRELGGRPEDATCYEKGRVRYERLARTELFRAGVERVIRGADEHRIALMCSEKEPLDCHRALAVAPSLARAGIIVEHILADGRLEAHGATMDRLLGLLAMPPEDLFRSKSELIAEALVRQAERVAYLDENLANGATGGAR